MDAVDIVKNIRCELQEALLTAYFKGNWIYASYVAYEFRFTSTINNNGDLNFTGFWPFQRKRGDGRVDGIAKIDYDKTRKGESAITIKETFNNVANEDCSSAMYFRSFKYPIKGKIGVNRVVDDFYRSSSIKGLSQISEFTRELEFKVVKAGSIDVTYFIAPDPVRPAGVLRRTFKTQLIFAADRADTHKVTFTFTAPDPRFIAGMPGALAYPSPPDHIKVLLVGVNNKTPPQIQIVAPIPKKGVRRETKVLDDKYVPPPAGPENQDRILRGLQRNLDRQRNFPRQEAIDSLIGR